MSKGITDPVALTAPLQTAVASVPGLVGWEKQAKLKLLLRSKCLPWEVVLAKRVETMGKSPDEQLKSICRCSALNFLSAEVMTEDHLRNYNLPI